MKKKMQLNRKLQFTLDQMEDLNCACLSCKLLLCAKPVAAQYMHIESLGPQVFIHVLISNIMYIRFTKKNMCLLFVHPVPRFLYF